MITSETLILINLVFYMISTNRAFIYFLYKYKLEVLLFCVVSFLIYSTYLFFYKLNLKNKLKNRQSRNTTIDEPCMICLETIINTDIINFTCNHKYHSGCVNKLIDEGFDSCPTCRENFV